MKTLLAAMVLYICCASPAVAATVEQLTPYFSIQHFGWQERIGGREILKESGALFSAGVVVGTVTQSPFTVRVKGELFGGKVNYRGETQAPESLPVATDVGYFGTREEVDLGYRLATARHFLEPFAGLGHRWWLRELHSSTAADGSAVSGYTESWQTVYGRLGARGQMLVSEGVTFSAEAGAKYPFYSGNSIDFADSGVTTLHPGARWSGFAEAGVGYKKAKLSLFYEGFRFSRSGTKRVQDTYYFQPASSSDIIGVGLGWAFR